MLKARRPHLLLVVAALWTGAAAAAPLPLDSDSDGVLDLLELTLGTNPFARDTDGDGTPDGEEILLDSDLDLRNNALESSIVDSDHDGVNDESDALEDDACFPDASVGACDTDGDGISNISEWDAGTDHLRGDTDRDGLDDDVEGVVDSDFDGLIDALEANVHDCDEDGTPDHLDPDSDNDGIEDGDEFPGDSDGDGKRNICDDDDDGDGVPTVLELLNGFISDRDDDSIPDYLDDDSDGDGLLDGIEGLGDRDGDGVADLIDFDDFDGPTGQDDEDGSLQDVDDVPSLPGEEAQDDVDGEVQPDDAPKLDVRLLIDLHHDAVEHEGVEAEGDDEEQAAEEEAAEEQPAPEEVDAGVGVEFEDRAVVDEPSLSCAAAPADAGTFVFAGLLALLRRRRR